VPTLDEKTAVIVAGEEIGVFQEFESFAGDLQRPPQNKRADGVGADDDRHERKKRIIEERARVNRDFVETEQKGDDGRHDGMETEKW